MVLANQLLSVARQFVDVRNCSIEEKQRYFDTVCGWFDLEPDENAFPLPTPRRRRSIQLFLTASTARRV
jgi:hypothetical protein